MEPYGNKNPNWAAAQAIQQQAALMANGQSLAAQQQLLLQQNSLGGQGQRVFTGTVTKLHDNFGFVDNDVFFPLSACKGGMPSMGDSVLVEAQFNPAMPFKWNATSVQVIMKSGQQGNKRYSGGGGGNARMQNNRGFGGNRQQQNKRGGGGGGAGILGPIPGLIGNQNRNQGRNNNQTPKSKQAKRRSPVPAKRERSRSASKDNTRKRSLSKASSTKRRSASPKAKRPTRRTPPKAAKRYTVQFAKYPLTLKSAGILELNSRYHSMYIPSDFSFTQFHWQECFTPENQFNCNPCHFQVMDKEVAPLVNPRKDELHPDDADSSWIARVMLLHVSHKNDMYKECCALSQDSSDKFIHQTRMFKFLLGYKSKKEVMAIGGLWSPSLDGPDPGSNPQTLIKTAIRTCRELTGVDLSKCTKWYRMLEVRYHRDAETDRGKPERMQTTVIYFPDVHNCMPSVDEYTALRDNYLKAYTDKYINKPLATTTNDEAKPSESMESDNTDKAEQAVESQPMDMEGMTILDESKDDTEEEAEKPANPFANMKVDALRQELKNRGLNTKGLKSQLLARLQKAVDDEKEKEKEKAEEEKRQAENEKEEDKKETKEVDNKESKEDKSEDKMEVDDKEEIKDDAVIDLDVSESDKLHEDEKKEESDKKEPEIDEAELRRVKKHYTLSSRRSILVHPSPTYKKGTFECSLTTLSMLLDYRSEDKKESMFEVYLFAECFNEMLQRDHAFNIYKSLKYLGKVKQEEEEEAALAAAAAKEAEKAAKEKEAAEEAKKEEEAAANGENEELKDSKEDEDDKTEAKKDDTSEKKDEETKKDETKVTIEKAVEKMVTARKELLLSFVYFDQSHTGYLRESDLNDIIHSIGLNLSRSQITKILSPFTEHGKLYYRKITDTEESKVDDIKSVDVAMMENLDTEMDQLLSGNQFLLKTTKVFATKDDSGIVTYKGATIDIETMMKQQKLDEQTRTQLELSNMEYKDKLDAVQRDYEKSQKEIATLKEDSDVVNKELTESRMEVDTLSKTKEKFTKIFDQMKTLVADTEEKAKVKSEET